MFTTFSKQNSRTRRKIAAGFKGEGTPGDFHKPAEEYGKLTDKEIRTAFLESHYARRDKNLRSQAASLMTHTGKHTGSKPLYKLRCAIAREC